LIFTNRTQIFGKCPEKNSGGQNVLLYHIVSVQIIKLVFYRGNRYGRTVDPSFKGMIHSATIFWGADTTPKSRSFPSS